MHNYAYSSDSVTRYYLSKRNIQKRIETAKEIIKTENVLVNSLVDQSYQFVLIFLNEANLGLPDSAFTDLESYTSSIKNNTELFLRGLEVETL
jgi:predicted rRNA methylase YqxC with S4 and FtsJ domains